MARLSLGLDSSTQSLSAVVVDIDSRETVVLHSLDYLQDARLARFGIDEEYLLPSSLEGEANQPVALYLASLDALFADLAEQFADLPLDPADIAVINVSGQQHGHVLLNDLAPRCLGSLDAPESDPGLDLVETLGPSLALPFARIWRTSCTSAQADRVRQSVGGSRAMIELTGSDAPLRFSAFGIRRTGEEYPESYRATRIIHQISSLIPAVLTGDADTGLDYGNACGTSLMDYRSRAWSPALIRAAAAGLPDGEAGLAHKLPELRSATSIVGRLADYFATKYGLSRSCAVGIGSGDNPQTKVLVDGSLLSLGTSIVIMVESDGQTFDLQGSANAMYDAFDRPFTFGCRTNGALRWDNVRASHGIARQDHGPGEAALASTPCGNRGRLLLWQAESESFPVSGIFGPLRIGYEAEDFATDYAGIVESTLAAVHVHSRRLIAPGDTLHVAGGATASAQILRRIAAIWNRRVIPIESGGAALGAAVSGAYALLISQGQALDAGEFGSSFLGSRAPIAPDPADVEAYHGAGGYLESYVEASRSLVGS